MYKLIPISGFCTTTAKKFAKESSDLSAISYPASKDTQTAPGNVLESKRSPSFSARIEREFIDGSAIAPDLFEAAIEFIEDTGFYEPNRALNHRVSTQWQTRKPHDFGTLAALTNEDCTLWQAKAENPRYDSKKEEFQKYETPVEQGSRAFLPAVTVRVWYTIAQHHKLLDRLPNWVRTAYQSGNYTLKSGSKGFGVNAQESSFWQWIEQHSGIQIILTEGGKKSLCLLSLGYVAIALYGCWGGVIRNDRIAGEKIRKLKPELISGLQPFAVPGRKFVTALDQDTKLKARDNVTNALLCTGRILTQSGCEVSIATWDKHDGKGIDDLIVNCGVAAWEKSHSEAVSFSQWSIANQLRNEVRRTPDLNIGDCEFVEVAPELPKSGIIALHGGKGSGKSKAIGQLLNGQKWLSITHRTSVGRDQGGGWKGAFVNDSDRHGSKLLKDGMPVDGGSVCVPSLLKVQAVEADILILDETTAVLEFMLASRLANKNGIRPLLLREFVDRIQSAKFVLLADADLTEEALQYIESIRGERAYLVRSERKALTYDAAIIDASENAAIALLQQHIEQLPDGKLIYINCDEKGRADSLTELLGHEQTLTITGDTSGGGIETSFLSSKGHDLPSLILQGIRYIVSSPSVTQGFSIEHHTDLIDSVWGFYSGCSISAHQIAQAPDRVRDSQIPRYFWITNKGSAYSKHSRAFTTSEYLKEFRQLNSTAARLVSHSLTPEALSAAESIDWQSENLKMFAALEVRRNRGMVALRETLIALLRKEGKRVRTISPNLTKSEIQAAKIAITEARRTTHKRYCEAVALALDLTPEAAKALENRTEALTPDEALALTKYYLKEFYELEAVTSDDVELDRRGRTRTVIKRLESVLYPDLATKRTARSIEQNPETPQDWKPDAVETWLLEQSGAAEMIRLITAREIERLPADRVQSVSEFVRSHFSEFRLAFHFRNVESLSNQQIVGEILSRYGIRTQRRGNKNNLRYEVCRAELETLLAIIERRRKRIAPLVEIDVDPEGAIAQNSDDSVDFSDIREMYESNSDPEARRMLQESIPPDTWRQAIHQIA